MEAPTNQAKETIEKGYKRPWNLEWDEYFMALAFLSAQRSKDPKTQVGACIVNEDKRIVGMGYNGMPNNCKDEEFPWGKGQTAEDNKHLYVCHAELNAVVNKIQSDIRGCSMYVTLFPCNECAKIIVQSRLKKVIYYKMPEIPKDKTKAQEKDEIRKAVEKMFEHGNIELKKYEIDRERNTVFKIGPEDSIIL
ncbi:deoxycytidylate deaminase-like [Mytilus californianus]|uniref:deoxycytidylate deaminase-like n=1 Tax=Mytilus californianus TaxID=6549 RepID=UPI002247404B|nr:deoxycytidylate deaminase-like [Mytilus californianus]XP_052078731.1 deoxycytidylate deaminase-like [Mytilus californianus]XP_052078732.1 deoxycytidylate deaminase-like [Mytilus californianus]